MLTVKCFNTVRPSGNLTGAEIATSFDALSPVIPVISKLVTTPSTVGSKTTVAMLLSAVRSRRREAAKNCVNCPCSAAAVQPKSVSASSGRTMV